MYSALEMAVDTIIEKIKYWVEILFVYLKERPTSY